MLNIKKYNFILLIFPILLVLTVFCTTALAVNINDNISINKTEFKQGDILIVKSNNSTDMQSIVFNQHQYQLRKYQNGQIAIIPISYWTNPGNYKLQVKKEKENYTTLITIVSGKFAKSYIEVDEQKKELIEPQKESTIKRKKADQKKINQARNSSIEDILIKDKFIWPVKGTISTEFGATRFVNGELTSRHSGIDIAAKKGTAVVAPNRGIVKMSANLLVTGNTIIIDHGFNIFSSYSHLSTLNVKKGKEVDKGEKIGEIGSTGFSTGPHLHWTVTVGSVFVNPRNFLENDILQ